MIRQKFNAHETTDAAVGDIIKLCALAKVAALDGDLRKARKYMAQIANIAEILPKGEFSPAVTREFTVAFESLGELINKPFRR